MRIAFVNQPIDGVLPPYQNSVGLWTYHIAPHVAQMHSVHVFGKQTRLQRSFSDSAGVHYHFVRALPNRVVNGLSRLVSRAGNGAQPFFASRLYYADYIAAVARTLRRLKPDIIHVYNFTQFVAPLRASCPRAQIVLHMHGEWLTQLDRELVRARIAKADLVLGASNYLTDTIRQRFPKFAGRCRTIYNGVDTELFTRPHVPTHAHPAGRRLLFVGRVSPEKGVHVLLEAFRSVAAHCPDVSLDIVGPLGAMPREYLVGLSQDPAVAQLSRFYDSDYPNYLRSLVPTELAGRVNFAGGRPQLELGDFYQAADILVNPSYSESFGLSLVESLACGRPVVATRVGGMVEIVDGQKVGLLVERGDAAGLAEALVTLLEDDTQRAAMGRNGRALVAKHFTWAKVAETFLSHYAALPEQTH